MSFLDDAKKAAQDALSKGKEFAAEHKDQVSGAIDKGGSMIDKQTKGKFADQVSKVTGKAGEMVDKLPDSKPGA